MSKLKVSATDFHDQLEGLFWDATIPPISKALESLGIYRVPDRVFDALERTLYEVLDNYTDPTHPDYDPEFSLEYRAFLSD
jgi:hypothetical protein